MRLFSKKQVIKNKLVGKAKNVMEKAGDRDAADEHFYREMEAKRKQKGIDKQYFDYEYLLVSEVGYEEISSTELKKLRKFFIHNGTEYFIFQVVFGYGVHPLRLWSFWFFFVGIFAAIYFIRIPRSLLRRWA